MKHGEILDKRYKIVGTLGQGGTAKVLLVENMVLNNTWAVKVLPKNSQWLSFELEEVEILKGLSHAMLPRIVDLFEDENSFFIVMDYFPGSNLMDLLQKEGKISESLLKKWTCELLDVLEYLHSRTPPVIYRDLKPANMIVDYTGRLRLVDFGTARFHKENSCEDTVYIGTQGYAAPEQYGTGRSDQRTDLYNLGMTLVNLATGVHPLKIESGRIITVLKSSGLSKELIRFITKLIEAEPKNRFQNAQEALKAINNAQRPKRLGFRVSLGKETSNSFKGVIGIASYLPGTGVTSLCLTLGRILARGGKSTALIEINSSGDFNRLEEVLDNLGELKIRRENSFEAGDMIFYPNMSDSGEISRKGVDIVILDLGQLNMECKLRELNRANIKLIMCPGVPWKDKLFSELDEGIKSPYKDEWIYITSIKNDENNKRKKHQYSLPFSLPKNTFYPTNEEQKKIEQAFKEICLIAESKHI